MDLTATFTRFVDIDAMVRSDPDCGNLSDYQWIQHGL
jgi:hypothetical protein